MGDTGATVRVGTGTKIKVSHFLSKLKPLITTVFVKIIPCSTYWTCNSRILQPGIFPLSNFIIWKLNKKKCNMFFSLHIPFLKQKQPQQNNNSRWSGTIEEKRTLYVKKVILKSSKEQLAIFGFHLATWIPCKLFYNAEAVFWQRAKYFELNHFNQLFWAWSSCLVLPMFPKRLGMEKSTINVKE